MDRAVLRMTQPHSQWPPFTAPYATRHSFAGTSWRWTNTTWNSHYHWIVVTARMLTRVDEVRTCSLVGTLNPIRDPPHTRHSGHGRGPGEPSIESTRRPTPPGTNTREAATTVTPHRGPKPTGPGPKRHDSSGRGGGDGQIRGSCRQPGTPRPATRHGGSVMCSRISAMR